MNNERTEATKRQAALRTLTDTTAKARTVASLTALLTGDRRKDTRTPQTASETTTEAVQDN